MENNDALRKAIEVSYAENGMTESEAAEAAEAAQLFLEKTLKKMKVMISTLLHFCKMMYHSMKELENSFAEGWEDIDTGNIHYDVPVLASNYNEILDEESLPLSFAILFGDGYVIVDHQSDDPNRVAKFVIWLWGEVPHNQFFEQPRKVCPAQERDLIRESL